MRGYYFRKYKVDSKDKKVIVVKCKTGNLHFGI